jgi:ribosomal protein S1
MATVRTVNTAILSGNFTNEELNSIAQAVNMARAELARKTAHMLSVGTKVTFADSRNNRVLSGTVTAIKVKNAVVDTGTVKYRVPMNMLTPV